MKTIKNKNILKYKDFEGTIEYSENDKCYFGKVLNIDGLVSYEGIDIVELETDFKNAIDFYLKTTGNK